MPPAATPAAAFYGPDRIGSTRAVFTAAGATATDYDPYGAVISGAAATTDFGYAGMVLNADSGLYLTQYRVYDPAVGRWLSRDPIGEGSDPEGNLYVYVSDESIDRVDRLGLYGTNDCSYYNSM